MNSILYRHSAVASCHFPRLLGKARPYYLIVPLLKQRFREMEGQAQHDRGGEDGAERGTKKEKEKKKRKQKRQTKKGRD